MGKKVNPKGIRLGITSTWSSRWFNDRDFAKNLEEDIKIRELIQKKWKSASISEVEIERSTGIMKLIISTSRPGVLIGRGGSGIEDISKIIKRKFLMNKNIELKIEVKEVKNFEEDASLLAQNVAEQLEKRVPFRKAMKSSLDLADKNKNIKGVKIEVSGRLGGADMSRREWLSKGRIPLQTLRANIDYARATADTTYGCIGVKAWIYKGDVFKKNNK